MTAAAPAPVELLAPSTIPLPPGMTIAWEQPGDEQFFWTMDKMHFPDPMPVLADVLTRSMYGSGLNHATALYDIPMRAQARRFWAHHYMTMAPLMLPEEELHAMGQRSEEKLGALIGRLEAQWADVWLPEIQAHLSHLSGYDLRSASMPELLVRLDDTVERNTRLWSIHFEIVLPVYMAISLFDEFYRDLFGNDSPFAAYALLQAIDNKTVETDHELYRLSERARALPEVRAIVTERPVEEIVAALGQSSQGQSFLHDLHAYLAVYGQRGNMWGIPYRSWIEDPAPAIKNLKDYVTQPERDPIAEQQAMAGEREVRIAEARERLASYPEAIRGQFEFLLHAAQIANALTEDHNYYIDFQGVYQVRRVFVALGERFERAGIIEQGDDIFHLTLDEIRASATAGSVIDRRDTVAERKAEIDRYRGAALPPAVGTAPPGPPPVNPVTTALGKLFGAPPQPSENPDELRGSAGSPGIVRGRARIARSLEDAASILPGDILVAETTSPPWTPLFATVAAVVTDTGGILSHCAVVAREYGIPAVVGVGMATTMLNDGDLLEVDGNQGIIRIIRES